MANSSEEQLSALIDGEISAQQLDALLARIKRNPVEAHRRLSRYGVISDAMHRRLPQSPSHNLHARVSEALKREPVMRLALRRVKPRRSWMRRAVGVALAASITAVVVVGFQWLRLSEGPAVETTATAQAAATDPLESYLLSHNEQGRSGSVHGVLPNARLVSPGWSE